MLNDRVDMIDCRTIKRINFIDLTFHSVTWIKNLHALHLDEWRFLLVKRASLKIIRKISFHVSGGQSGPFGRTVRGLLFFT
jgi:hypothetical protein